MENVVLVTVTDIAAARDVRAELEALHGEHGFRLEEAAVVERTLDGRLTVHEHPAAAGARATAAGTAVGAVIGLLSGPLGLLVGGATGAVVGSLVDVAEADDARSMVDALVRSVPPGRAAVVALVDEPTPTLLARVATASDGTVLRHSRDEVELRLAEAEVEARSADRHGDDQLSP